HRTLPPGDVDLQLVDPPLLLFEHETDHVAHGDDADDPALVGDEQMAGEVHAHQVSALSFRCAGRDGGQVPSHRVCDALLAAAAFGEHVVDEIALGHHADDPAALLHRYGADVLLRHDPRGFAAFGRSVEGDELAREMAIDARHRAQ